MASHVAAIVARWQANQALKQANDELATSAETLRLLGDIGKDLTGSLDALAICRTLETHFAELMPMDAFGVALLSPAGDMLDYVHYVEDGVVDDRRRRYPLDHPTSLAVLTLREDRELTLFNETQLRQRAERLQHFAESAPILSAVFRPLIANGRRIGVVTVQSHQADAYHERAPGSVPLRDRVRGDRAGQRRCLRRRRERRARRRRRRWSSATRPRRTWCTRRRWPRSAS